MQQITLNLNSLNMQQGKYCYAYMNHKQNFPLELKGNMKKRSSQIDHSKYKAHMDALTAESKTLLVKKIQSNIHRITNNKSVIPSEEPKRKLRASSIRCFNEKENIKASGVEYLMQKSPEKVKLKQRSHFVVSRCTTEQKQSGKGKRHFDKDEANDMRINNTEEVISRHKQTMRMKVANDLHSQVHKKQEEKYLTRKQVKQTNNLFKTSDQLGFNQSVRKRISDQKMIEMVGSEHCPTRTQATRNRREDWRLSSIQLI